ncbi:MAG TPA: helix-turn-helix domain-containing protein [Candidatus Udaeobacter sp.]|nr:helix-turn-helix domain-containing protein [Candidatus Udaeobacter sp.]
MREQIQDNTGSSENLLSKTQAAQRLGVSVRNLDYRVKDGSIPFVKIGRLLRFIPSDIEKFIEAHKIGG